MNSERGSSEAVFFLLMTPMMVVLALICFQLVHANLELEAKHHQQQSCIMNVSTHACK